MLRAKHKLKIDVDSRIFSISGFHMVLTKTQGLKSCMEEGKGHSSSIGKLRKEATARPPSPLPPVAIHSVLYSCSIYLCMLLIGLN
jgi:hypothetical protein